MMFDNFSSIQHIYWFSGVRRRAMYSLTNTNSTTLNNIYIGGILRYLMVLVLPLTILTSNTNLSLEERCKQFSIPKGSCLESAYYPTENYEKFLHSFNYPILKDKKCELGKCRAFFYKNECDICENEECLRECNGKKSNKHELLEFIKNIIEKKNSKSFDLVENGLSSSKNCNNGTLDPTFDLANSPETIYHTRKRSRDKTVTRTVTIKEIEPPKEIFQVNDSIAPTVHIKPVEPQTVTIQLVNSNDKSVAAGSSSANCNIVSTSTITAQAPIITTQTSTITASQFIPTSSESPNLKEIVELIKDIKESRKSHINTNRKKPCSDSDESHRSDSKILDFSANHEISITLTRFVEKTKTVEKPLTLYREFTTTVVKTKPITNYKVVTYTEELQKTATKVVERTVTITRPGEGVKIETEVPRQESAARQNILSSSEKVVTVSKTVTASCSLERTKPEIMSKMPSEAITATLTNSTKPISVTTKQEIVTVTETSTSIPPLTTTCISTGAKDISVSTIVKSTTVISRVLPEPPITTIDSDVQKKTQTIYKTVKEQIPPRTIYRTVHENRNNDEIVRMNCRRQRPDMGIGSACDDVEKIYETDIASGKETYKHNVKEDYNSKEREAKDKALKNRKKRRRTVYNTIYSTRASDDVVTTTVFL